ncbi:MAG: alkaline phosphatase family protein, partial [Candidatus Bathyarchaeota archaeon]|nr:alkaline phosphatase family protein [Candidatus Bathyarchaeota archaeon]
MILKEIEKEIEKEKGDGNFIYPYYEKYCFSNIPSMILELFNVKPLRQNILSQIIKDRFEIEKISKIVLFLIDGLGYNVWTNYLEKFEVFHNFTEKGTVMSLTSVFPSTTAATLTTINSGLTPQEHGLPEWVTYFKEIDMLINTLPFSPLEIGGRDELLKMQVSPRILYKGETIYQILKRSGVESFSFINESYAHSAYSRLVHKGSKKIPFIYPSDLAVKLKSSIKEESEPAYFYVYIDDIDYVGHKYGPDSDEFLTELTAISKFFSKFFNAMDKKTASETIILIIADHGIIGVSPNDTIYLNKYKRLIKNLQISENGNLIPPTGSPRDVFLHIKQDKIEEMYDFLSEELKEKA